MPEWDITGSWVGEYTYTPGPGYATLPPATGFTLTARRGWFGRFQGVIRDDPTRGVPEEATVQGHVSGLQITFWKQYPAMYCFDRGKLVSLAEYLERLQGLHIYALPVPDPIRYVGAYDPAAEAARGQWQISAGVMRFRSGGRLLEVQVPASTGQWVMRREAS